MRDIEKIIIAGMGIAGIVFLVAFALYKGVDGIMFGAGMSTLGVIVGIVFGRKFPFTK